MQDVGVHTTLSRHAHERRAANEVLNNLLEFARLLFRSRAGTDAETDELLKQVSLRAEGGQVVGVLSTRTASARTFLEAVAGMIPLDSGSIEIRGRAASLGQIPAALAPFDSCRSNLTVLARFLGAGRRELREALSRVETICSELRVLDMPLRRVPRWVFDDLGLVLICELDFAVLVAPEIDLPTSEQVSEYWHEYLGKAQERGQLILAGSRRGETLKAHISKLILLEEGEVRAFDTYEAIESSQPDLLKRALAARPEPKESELLLDLDDDDEEEAELEELELAALPDGERHEREELDERLKIRRRNDGEEVDESDGRRMLNGRPYRNRPSEHCSILLAETEGRRLLHPDLTPAVPVAENDSIRTHVGPLPVVYREEGAVVRLEVETHTPNLWLLPGIDMMLRKIPLLRSFPSEEIFVPRPCRLSFDIRIPAYFMDYHVYRVNAFVFVADEANEIDDLTIAWDYSVFGNISREGATRIGVAQMLGRERHDYPIFFDLPRRATRTPVEETGDFRLLSLALAGGDGEPLEKRDGGYYVEADDRDYDVVVTIQVFRRLHGLVLLAEFWREEGVELRLRSQPMTLARGFHQLRLPAPPDTLPEKTYQLRAGVMDKDMLDGPDANPTQTLDATVHISLPQVASEGVTQNWRGKRSYLHGPLVWKRRRGNTKKA